MGTSHTATTRRTHGAYARARSGTASLKPTTTDDGTPTWSDAPLRLHCSNVARMYSRRTVCMPSTILRTSASAIKSATRVPVSARFSASHASAEHSTKKLPPASWSSGAKSSEDISRNPSRALLHRSSSGSPFDRHRDGRRSVRGGLMRTERVGHVTERGCVWSNHWSHD